MEKASVGGRKGKRKLEDDDPPLPKRLRVETKETNEAPRGRQAAERKPRRERLKRGASELNSASAAEQAPHDAEGASSGAHAALAAQQRPEAQPGGASPSSPGVPSPAAPAKDSPEHERERGRGSGPTSTGRAALAAAAAPSRPAAAAAARAASAASRAASTADSAAQTEPPAGALPDEDAAFDDLDLSVPAIQAARPHNDGPTIILRLVFPRILAGSAPQPVPLDDVVPRLWLNWERGARQAPAAAAPSPGRVLTRAGRQRQLREQQQQEEQQQEQAAAAAGPDAPPSPDTAAAAAPEGSGGSQGPLAAFPGSPALQGIPGVVQLRVILERRAREAREAREAQSPPQQQQPQEQAQPGPAAAAAEAAGPAPPQQPAAAAAQAPPARWAPEDVVAVGIATVLPALGPSGVPVPFTPEMLDGISRFVLLEVLVQHQLRQPKGVAEAALGQHTQLCTWGHAEREVATCTVCTEDACAGESVRRLRCGHRFHASCVDRWLQQSVVCPNCRETVVPPHERVPAPAAATAAA